MTMSTVKRCDGYDIFVYEFEAVCPFSVVVRQQLRISSPL